MMPSYTPNPKIQMGDTPSVLPIRYTAQPEGS